MALCGKLNNANVSTRKAGASSIIAILTVGVTARAPF